MAHEQKFRTRTIAACDADAVKFNWEEYNRRFDDQLDQLRRTLAEMDSIERAIHQTHIDMVSDMRAMLEATEKE